MKVSEANFQVLADSLVNAVGILHHAFVHAPNAVGNVVFTAQALHGVLARKSLDLGGDLLCFLLGDELGGLHAVHQKPKLVRLKGWI